MATLERFNLWPIVDVLRQPWRRMDRFMQQRYAASAHHAFLDHSISWIKGKTIFFPYGFYPDGFGNFELPLQFYNHLKTLYSDIRTQGVSSIPTIEPTIEARTVVEEENALVEDITFPTPSVDVLDQLPEESWLGRAQVVSPLEVPNYSNAANLDPFFHELPFMKPVVVILAGTGEQGFRRRRYFLSYPLARLGVTTMVLESPFYGKRRPPTQVASKLRKVSDLPLLGRVTIEEALSSLEWLRRTGRGEAFVLAGNSMGGLHAAMTSCLYPQDTGIVSWLGPPSAASVFTRGCLSRACEWDSLIEDAKHPDLQRSLDAYDEVMQQELAKDDFERMMSVRAACVGAKPPTDAAQLARYQLFRFLQLTELTHFAPPLRPDAASFFVASEDQYIPRSTVSEYWQAIRGKWGEDVSIRWMRGGHVSGTLFPEIEYPMAVVESFKKLMRYE